MELNGILPILRRWAGVIVMATVIAAGVGLVIGKLADPTYEAKASLLIGPVNTDANTARSSAILAQTYTQLVLGDPIVAEAARRSNVRFAKAKEGVSATANETTRFITVKARSADPLSAQKLANSLGTVLISRTGGNGIFRPEGQLTVVDPAAKPTSPVAPRLGLIVPLAALAGLLGALTLVLLVEYLSDTAKTPEEVAEVAGAPCLVNIVSRGRRRSPGLIAEGRPGRSIKDYRLLATQLELSANPLRCVLVVGVDEGDGAGTLAANLATVYATRRDRVTLVDAGGGEVTVLSGLSAETGLSEAIQSASAPISVVTGARRLPFAILPGGRRGRLEAIRMDDARRVVDELAADDGIVVVHAAPPLISAAALVWARVADATIVGVRRQRTRRRHLTEAVEHLRTTGAHLVGLVLHDSGLVPDPNEAPRRPSRRSGPSEPALPTDPAAPVPAGTLRRSPAPEGAVPQALGFTPPGDMGTSP